MEKLDKEYVVKVANKVFDDMGEALRIRYSREEVRAAIVTALKADYGTEDPNVCLESLEALDDVGLDIFECVLVAMFKA